jgi:AcrR family transcriptional regulator
LSRTDLIWNRPEPGARRPRFTRDSIAATAIRIADTEGFGAVSMRRVAAELGAGTMTLYHYVRNKGELVSLMDDAIMGELIVAEDELPSGWREALTALAHRTRAAFERHPWAFTALRGAQGGPNGLRHFEQSLTATADTGLDLREQLAIISTIDDYVLGFVVRVGEMKASAADARELVDSVPAHVVEYFDGLLATGEFPHVKELFGDRDLREAIRELIALFADEDRFDRGLQRVLDGIELELERRR